MIDSVRTLCGMASNERITHSESAMNKPNSYGDNSEYIIHYSRNTAFKQWCETQVLVLNGISRLLCLKLELFVNHSLDSSNNPPAVASHSETNESETSLLLNVWSLFFEFIYSSSISNNPEVSNSAMKCFNEIVIFLNDYSRLNQNTENSIDQNIIEQAISPIWIIIWKTWCNIGHNVGKLPISECVNSNGGIRIGLNGQATNQPTSNNTNQLIISSQPFLCLLVKPLFFILPKIINQFTDRFVTFGIKIQIIFNFQN